MGLDDKNQIILAAVAGEMKESGCSLGRTKFQKIVFLLSELYDVKTTYKFRFYTYGPFSNGLAGDIDYLAKIDILDSVFHLSDGFYAIEPGEKFDKPHLVTSLDSKIIEDIRTVVKDFGSKNASQLELMSTIVFVNRFDERGSDEKLLKDKTLALKPKFTLPDVDTAIQSLRQHLKFSPATLSAGA
jgi:uncharacterized protein